MFKWCDVGLGALLCPGFADKTVRRRRACRSSRIILPSLHQQREYKSPRSCPNTHQHLIVPFGPSAKRAWNTMRRSRSSFSPLTCPSLNAGGYFGWLLAGAFNALETPQAGEGGLVCVLLPWREEC